MEIKLREQVRLKSNNKLGTVVGWERKFNDEGAIIERFTVRLEEPVHYWYPCSMVGETVPGHREVKVSESEIQRIKLDNVDDWLDSLRYSMYAAFRISPKILNPIPGEIFYPEESTCTIKLPDLAPAGTLFSIRDEHGVREYKPTPKFQECECGKEKHGFASHSNWCPIKENT